MRRRSARTRTTGERARGGIESLLETDEVLEIGGAGLRAGPGRIEDPHALPHGGRRGQERAGSLVPHALPPVLAIDLLHAAPVPRDELAELRRRDGKASHPPIILPGIRRIERGPAGGQFDEPSTVSHMLINGFFFVQ